MWKLDEGIPWGISYYDEWERTIWIFPLAPWRYWAMSTWLHLKLTLPHYKKHMGWHCLYLIFIAIWWK